MLNYKTNKTLQFDKPTKNNRVAQSTSCKIFSKETLLIINNTAAPPIRIMDTSIRVIVFK
jgi:hypothetical protein